jgi:hypothetical protein
MKKHQYLNLNFFSFRQPLSNYKWGRGAYQGSHNFTHKRTILFIFPLQIENVSRKMLNTNLTSFV